MAIHPILRELVSDALAEGSRSTALKPLHWIVAILLGGTLFGIFLDAPSWFLITLVGMFVICVLLFGYAYLVFLKKDPDALRSEIYSLRKFAIEKGLYGDNLSGMIDIDQDANQRSILPGPSSENEDEA